MGGAERRPMGGETHCGRSAPISDASPRAEADRSAERGREEARRGREYEERYASERAAEEPQTEAPRDDMGKPE